MAPEREEHAPLGKVGWLETGSSLVPATNLLCDLGLVMALSGSHSPHLLKGVKLVLNKVIFKETSRLGGKWEGQRQSAT